MLLGLVMIVKNEAHGIADTLYSFKPIIDCWTILDTGSTDGTQGVIREVLQGVPGTLHEEPFVDFSTSRNRVLDLHGERSVLTIMPDSDDKLQNAGVLRAFCEAKRLAEGVSEEAYGINIRRGTLSYYLPLLLRASAHWRYTGRVHEYCSRPGGPAATQRVPLVALTQDVRPQSAEASKARWHRDLVLLQADLAANPQDSRAAFYLAQTYECVGQYEDAITAYDHRISVGGWKDETFEAMLRKAKIMQRLGRPWPEVIQAYLAAYQFDPRRAEPLFEIGLYYYRQHQNSLAYFFTSRAETLSVPDTAMFVDLDVYRWRNADILATSAFYVSQEVGDEGIRVEGERAARKAVRAQPDDNRLRANWAFYAPTADAVFRGYRTWPIAFSPPAPYHALNPSIWWDGERWRCLIRTVNYQIVGNQYLTPNNEPIVTRNHVAELSRELEVERVVEMTDLDSTPRSAFPVHGFEDCRLFSVGGRLFATCTACDMNDDRGSREIVLLSIAPDYSITSARPLRGPWSKHHQKNWMPVVDEDEVRIIYATSPETILELDVDQARAHAQDPTDFSFGRLRGGSQAVRVPEGWLVVVHDVAWAGANRLYTHRFALLSDSLKLRKLSDPFYFQKPGIEFCAGLGFDGHQLVASYAVNDSEPCLATFQLDDVLGRLTEDFVV